MRQHSLQAATPMRPAGLTWLAGQMRPVPARLGRTGCPAARPQSLAADQLGLTGPTGRPMRQQSLQAATPMSPAGLKWPAGLMRPVPARLGRAGRPAARPQSLAADQLGLTGPTGRPMRQQSLQAATPMGPAGLKWPAGLTWLAPVRLGRAGCPSARPQSLAMVHLGLNWLTW